MTLVPALAALLVLAAPSPSPSPTAAPDAASIVALAIKARGGEEALKRSAVLEWRGRAMVHAEEDETSAFEGRWIVEAPDRAVVVTSEVGKGRGSSRRMVFARGEGWTESDGERKPMPAEVAAGEGDQLYLSSLLRVLPLRDPGVRLTATGPRSLRVEKDGRPTVDMVFDGTGWLDRMTARVRDPEGEGTVEEEITFAGEVVARGLRWPRRINISRDGKPYVDLEIDELRAATPADLERESQRRR